MDLQNLISCHVKTWLQYLSWIFHQNTKNDKILSDFKTLESRDMLDLK